MQKFRFYLLGLLFIAFIVGSCDKEEETVVNESELLVEYLESAESPLMKDYISTDLPAIISAEAVFTKNSGLTDLVYVIDIRSAADFANGHIENAHNVAVKDLLTHIKSIPAAEYAAYDNIAIACYSGQTACYVTTLLKVMGYSKVAALKWGMSSWHTNFAANFWNKAGTTGNAGLTYFVSTASAKAEQGSLPVLSTGKTTAQEILEVRVDSLLVKGFSAATVSSATVFANLSNYYIVNYWPASQYADPGHIQGAIQYTPKESMKSTVDLKTLPTDKTIAVYCYTGQTSAGLVAYLRLLGYDAKTVSYGTNGMIFDKMITYNTANPTTKMSVFNANEIKGYAYQTNPGK